MPTCGLCFTWHGVLALQFRPATASCSKLDEEERNEASCMVEAPMPRLQLDGGGGFDEPSSTEAAPTSPGFHRRRHHHQRARACRYSLSQR
jgi:hypothetical protein